MVNKESKRSRRFVCYCDTSSGDKNYCKQGSFILYTGGPAERSIIRSIIGTITPNAYWSTHTVIDRSPRPLVRPLVRLMHPAYWPTHTVLNQSTGRWLGPSAEWNRPFMVFLNLQFATIICDISILCRRTHLPYF